MIDERVLFDRTNGTQPKRPSLQREVYAGVPEPGDDLLGAVQALKRNVETLIGVGGPNGAALTIEDIGALVGGTEARVRSGETGSAPVLTLDQLSVQLRALEDELLRGGLVAQQIAADLTSHVEDLSNPHEVQHEQLTDRNSPGAHAQTAIQPRLTSGLQNLAEEQDQQDSRLDALEANGGGISALEQRVTALEGQVTALQATVSDHEARILALEAAP
jgi:chromosome segregation ATPase